MFTENLLLAYGANYKRYKRGEVIFYEGENAQFYYQVVEGKVKMTNENENGSEFIQGFFYSNESFGEPCLFIPKPYPATAIAELDTLLIRLSSKSFQKLIHDFPDCLHSLIETLCQRLYTKSSISKELSGYSPEHRIISLFESYRNKYTDGKTGVLIDLTRQQVAGMTGLRVETVIRAVKNMERKGILQIIGGKVVF